MNIQVSVKQILIYLIIPTYLLSGGYGPIKFIFIFPLAIFMILAILIVVRKKLYKKFFTHHISFFIILATLSLASIVDGASLRSYLEVFEIVVGLTVILLLNQYITDRNSISKILTVIKFVVFISAMHAMAQYFAGERVTGPYSNENRLATLYVFVAPFYLAELCKKFKLSNIFILGLIAVVLILVGSRFSQLCFLIAGFFTVIELIKSSRIKQKRYIVFAFIVGSIIIAPLVLSVIGSEQGKSLSDQSQSKGGSLALRFFLFSEGLRIFEESNYMGVGAGNIYTNSYWDDEVAEGSLHNHALSLLATYGLLGFLSFVYMYIYLIKDYRNLNTIYDNREYLFALKIFLIIFILASNSPSSLFQFRPFYFIFGFYFSILNIYKKECVR